MHNDDVIRAISDALLQYFLFQESPHRVLVSADSVRRLVEELRDDYLRLRENGYDEESILTHWSEQALTVRRNVLELAETIKLADGTQVTLVTETITGKALDLCPDPPP